MPEILPAAPTDRRDRRLATGFLVLAGFTFCLIDLGALVRAFDAGLACPDWPLCYGEVVPPFDLQVAFEWGHRAFAGSISIGLFVLSAMGWSNRALRSRLVFAWALLLTQVVFGGLTVLLLLAPWTVAVHLILGNSFCLTLLWIGLDIREGLSDAREQSEIALPAGVPFLAGLCGLVVALQMVLGGWVSSHYAGLACAHFPTCDGEAFVPTLAGPVGMHVLHRLNGVLLFGLMGVLAWRARGTGRPGRLAVLALGLITIQIAVGAANVIFLLPWAVTGLHSALATAIVLATALIVRDVLRVRQHHVSEPVMNGRIAEAQ
ncbi:COX15/CtaA family protein [Myxococcota bacterium]|nr:COX15/CtaA family protein [Myxococcota bacterium]